MKLTTTNKQQVEDVAWGMLVWRAADGEILGDGDGNVMNVFVINHYDQKELQAAKKSLAEAAKYYGYVEGESVWWSGRRPISDEELAEQQTREKLGLVPDPLDVGAIRDEMRAKKQHGR